MSQELLPMYTVRPMLEREPSGASPTQTRWFLFGLGGGATPPKYEALSPCDPEEDVKKGLLVAESGDATSPLGTPLVASATAPAAATPAATCSCRSNPAATGCVRPSCGMAKKVYAVLYEIAWYPRMLAFFMLIGGSVALVCTIVLYIVATVVIFGWVAPMNRLPSTAGFTACAAGGPIVGAVAGACGWVIVCARRVYDTFYPPVEEVKPVLPQPVTITEDEARERLTRVSTYDDDGPTHPAWHVATAAALVSMFGFAVGVAVVPSVAAVAAEKGFSVGLAVGYGVWGAAVPFVPFIVVSVFTTLGACDPFLVCPGVWDAIRV